MEISSRAFDDHHYSTGRGLKRPGKLNLDSQHVAKRTKPSLLTTPDVQMLKFASPELERIVLSLNMVNTPTPTKIIFPPSVTDDQERYVRPFVEALDELHRQKKKNQVFTTMADPSLSDTFEAEPGQLLPTHVLSAQSAEPGQSVYLNLDTINVAGRYCSPLVKEEPQTVPNMYVPSSSVGPQPVASSGRFQQSMMPIPLAVQATSSSSNCSSPCSSSNGNIVQPINLQHQECAKLERKRARNRVAARNCRQRKLDRIETLEKRVSDLKQENQKLSATMADLRNQTCNLKDQIIAHMNAGCNIVIPDLSAPSSVRL